MGEKLRDKKLPVSEIVFLIPVFVFVLSIVIVRTHVSSMPMSQFFWFGTNNENQLTDVYCYYKHLMVYVAALLSFAFTCVHYVKHDNSFRFNKIYIPCAVYIIFAVISFIFSDYKYFALHGMNDHFQGIFVLISYILLLIYIYSNVRSDFAVKSIICAILSVVTLLGILGLTQALKHDFFQTNIGQKLITPNIDLGNGLTAWEAIDLLGNFGEKGYDYLFTQGEVYQTVFNINFVPFYLTLLIPVVAMLSIGAMSKEKKNYLLYIVMLAIFGLILYNFFAANSASGYFGLVAIVLGGIIVFNKRIIKWIRPLISLVLVCVLVMGLLADRWLPEVKSKFVEGTAFVLSFTADDIYGADMPEHFSKSFDNGPATLKPNIDYISTVDGRIEFSINGEVIVVSRDEAGKKFDLFDLSGDQIVLGVKKDAPDRYELLDTRFHDYVYMQLGDDEGIKYVIFNTPSREWQFKYTGNEFLYQTPVGGETPLRKVEHSDFIKDFSFGSWRGGIWNTTIPLLSKYIVKGFGPDCYTIAYPQEDYATMYSTGWDTEGVLVVDKAHNMYLQIWVETGLISLIAWIGIVLCYLFGAIKYIRRHGFVDIIDFINGGIFLGILGFVATGFFNDGSVNTWPMFFTILGTGLAINARDSWNQNTSESAEDVSDEPKVKAMPMM